MLEITNINAIPPPQEMSCPLLPPVYPSTPGCSRLMRSFRQGGTRARLPSPFTSSPGTMQTLNAVAIRPFGILPISAPEDGCNGFMVYLKNSLPISHWTLPSFELPDFHVKILCLLLPSDFKLLLSRGTQAECRFPCISRLVKRRVFCFVKRQSKHRRLIQLRQGRRIPLQARLWR